jgi:large subunit ribosomal protein L25
LELKLTAETREETGKGPVKRLRVQGGIPAVLYGPGLLPHNLVVKKEDLGEVLHTEAGANVLIDLQVVDGKKKESHLVMIKEIQRHPFKEKFLHVDFVKVARDEKVTTKVPIAVSGEAESLGLKNGGTLQHNIWEVEVECLPADMPDHLYVDVSMMDIGDHLRVSDLTSPPGVTILTDADDTILTVLAPRVIEVEVPEVAEVAEELAPEEEEVAPAKEKPGEAVPPAGGEES